MSTTDRVHALAFNALTKALGEADVFVLLSDREAITAAVVTAVRLELAAEIEAVFVMAHPDQTPAEAKAEGLRTAARIARGER